MSTYKELEEEFNRKVRELRGKCKHEDVSDWIKVMWAPGHYSNVQVRVCEACRKTVASREPCWSCGGWIEDESKAIKGDGVEIPIGVTLCSQTCVDTYKAKRLTYRGR